MLGSCTDTPAWNNLPRPGGPLSCADYVTSRLCASGGFVSGAEWAGGEAFNFPEFNCCACGKGQNKGSVARNTAASKLLNARGPWRPPKREPPAATAPRGRSRSRGRGAARAKTPTSPKRTEAEVREAAAATVEALPRKGDYPPGVERTPLVDTLLELERGGVKAAAATAPARIRRDGDVRSARRDAKARRSGGRLPDCFDRKLESPKLPWNEEAFCPRWPAYGAEERALSPAQQAAVRDAARRALRPFDAGVSREQVRAAVQPRCAQRLCAHVQILGGKLYVVAPPSQRCPRSESAKAENDFCTMEQRRKQSGVYKLWTPGWNPTRLEWHWYAGLNVSECSSKVRQGDWNGAFTRQRWLSALRLLEEAARQGVPDTELVLCVQETPINAGDWCLKGPQPVFSPTGNDDHPLVPWPHWMPQLRDFDLSVWDTVRAAQLARGTPTTAEKVAGFRGGVYRLNIYSDRWRTLGARRTPVTRQNWRDVGRTALLAFKERGGDGAASLLNLHLKVNASLKVPSKWGGWTQLLGVPDATKAMMDAPYGIPMSAQARKFAYTVNVEGHGGWADRLYQLLLSPMLVLAQDLPFKLWYEHFGAAGTTHLAVDSNLRNLSDAIRWARAHDAEARAMVGAAQRAMDVATSVAGIRLYVKELLTQYSALLRGSGGGSAPLPRAVRFVCEPTAECRSCAGEGGKERAMCGERCSFVGPTTGTRFETLHFAGKEFEREGARPTRRRPAANNASAARVACKAWCGDVSNPLPAACKWKACSGCAGCSNHVRAALKG